MPRQTRKTNMKIAGDSHRVSSHLDKNLLAYAVAAGATGVGLLASAPLSEAKIVFTPTHQTVSQGSSLKLDLNGDGITDFTISNTYSAAGKIVNTGSQGSAGSLRVAGANASNQAVSASPRHNGFARALITHYQVGPANKFGSASNPFMEECFIVTGTFLETGSWFNVTNRYLGLKFIIGGQIHYGWARLSVRESVCSISAVLTGYAYETVAGMSIVTGKTSGPDGVRAAGDFNLLPAEPVPPAPTLGMLAYGAPGLAIWRREDEFVR